MAISAAMFNCTAVWLGRSWAARFAALALGADELMSAAACLGAENSSGVVSALAALVNESPNARAALMRNFFNISVPTIDGVKCRLGWELTSTALKHLKPFELFVTLQAFGLCNYHFFEPKI
ncbi:MAG: hypothetical protein H7Z77_10875 [Chitinophagaceae bacterium]|nr:hypothetical protein [Polaromonas sp.]